MAQQHLRTRPAFTPLDLLVVIFLVGVLAGILLPAIQDFIETELRLECMSKMRQLGTAAHIYAGDIRKLPNAATYGDGGVYAGKPEDVAKYDSKEPFKHGWAFAILPYIEQDALYKAAGGNPHDVRAGNLVGPEGSRVASQKVHAYLCPADPGGEKQFAGITLSDGKGWARGNYAANAGPALITESINGNTVSMKASGAGQNDAPLVAMPVMAVNFGMTLAALSSSDGSSHTILFNEVRIGLNEKDLRGTWALAVPGASITCGNAGRQDKGAYVPTDRCSQPNDKMAGSDDIQGCPDPGDKSWEGQGMGCKNNKEGSFFAQARSRHVLGLNVCFADGSTRFVRNDTKNLTWFYILSAADGQTVPDF